MRLWPDPTTDPALAVVERDVAEIVEQLGSRLERLGGATILVTGASGMLGAYVADVAASLGRLGAVREPCTLYLATRRQPQPGDRLGHLLGRPNVRFVVGDPARPSSLPESADFIVHPASPASPQHYFADPVGTLDANSRYLRTLLDLARERRARSFVYISSSEVYGDPPPSAIPTQETYIGAVDPLSPRACYVEGKRFGESLCLAFHRQFDVPVTVIRPFHVHGPGLRLTDGRIVAELIRAGLNGIPFTLSSDGTATRCYGYVSDAISGLYAALLGGQFGEAFNIGVDEPETSILDLARTIAELMDAPAPRASTQAVPAHLAEAPSRSRPDLRKARTLLGYSPRVSLRDGLTRTIAWHRARMAAGLVS